MSFGVVRTGRVNDRKVDIFLEASQMIRVGFSQVQDKLREFGLESSNLIVAVDFTKSNEWTGEYLPFDIHFGSFCHWGAIERSHVRDTHLESSTKRTNEDNEQRLMPIFITRTGLIWCGMCFGAIHRRQTLLSGSVLARHWVGAKPIRVCHPSHRRDPVPV